MHRSMDDLDALLKVAKGVRDSQIEKTSSTQQRLPLVSSSILDIVKRIDLLFDPDKLLSFFTARTNKWVGGSVEHTVKRAKFSKSFMNDYHFVSSSSCINDLLWQSFYTQNVDVLADSQYENTDGMIVDSILKRLDGKRDANHDYCLCMLRNQNMSWHIDPVTANGTDGSVCYIVLGPAFYVHYLFIAEPNHPMGLETVVHLNLLQAHIQQHDVAIGSTIQLPECHRVAVSSADCDSGRTKLMMPIELADAPHIDKFTMYRYTIPAFSLVSFDGSLLHGVLNGFFAGQDMLKPPTRPFMKLGFNYAKRV